MRTDLTGPIVQIHGRPYGERNGEYIKRPVNLEVSGQLGHTFLSLCTTGIKSEFAIASAITQEGLSSQN
jgi:hypothetical protein